jgi:hypothetical protein
VPVFISFDSCLYKWTILLACLFICLFLCFLENIHKLLISRVEFF